VSRRIFTMASNDGAGLIEYARRGSKLLHCQGKWSWEPTAWSDSYPTQCTKSTMGVPHVWSTSGKSHVRQEQGPD
jgi:hypothetical protein